MRVVGYVLRRLEPGVVRIMSVHSIPNKGVLLRPAKPPLPVCLAFDPTEIVNLGYDSAVGQGVPETRCLTSDTPNPSPLTEDVTGALIAGGYVSPVLIERRCKITLQPASVLPFVLAPQEEAKYRSSDDLGYVLRREKERLQPGVPYPIEVAPPSAAVQYRGNYEETIGLDYGVLTLTRTEPGDECVGLLQLVVERDGEKPPPFLALYRFGRPVGKAELL